MIQKLQGHILGSLKNLKESFDRISICLNHKTAFFSTAQIINRLKNIIKQTVKNIKSYMLQKLNNFLKLKKDLKQNSNYERILIFLIYNYKNPFNTMQLTLIKYKNNGQHYVCHFCGQTLTYQIANTDFLKNKDRVVRQFQGYFHPKPQSQNQVLLHYFAKTKSI